MSAGQLTRLIQVIAAVSGRPADQITAGTSLTELGLDSLDRVVLASRVEQDFAVVLPDDVLAGVFRVGDLVGVLAVEAEGRA
jgi:acyl carrier protein